MAKVKLLKIEKIGFSLFIILLCFLFCRSAHADKIFTQKTTIDGISREYVVYKPENSKGEVLPVVLAFHGEGQTSEEFMKQTGLDALAEKEHFLLVLPQGWKPLEDHQAKINKNPQTWNDGSNNYPSNRQNIDDVKFVKTVIEELKKNYIIDFRKIYAIGFSNGASFVLKLSVEMSDSITAIGIVSPPEFYVDNPHLIRPVPFVYIQGSNDPINLYTGGHIQDFGINEYRRSSDKIVKNLIQMDGCQDGSHIEQPTFFVSEIIYNYCPIGMDAEYYIIGNMGHVWAGGKNELPESVVGYDNNSINASQVIWDFISQYTLDNSH